jgi:hypothetical protein
MDKNDISKIRKCSCMSPIHCLRCEGDISGNSFFYTLARNGYMFGFFCCSDCAQASEHNRFLNAFVLRVSKAPDTHRDLVLVPDLQTLKRYSEELKKRSIRKKYL